MPERAGDVDDTQLAALLDLDVGHCPVIVRLVRLLAEEAVDAAYKPPELGLALRIRPAEVVEDGGLGSAGAYVPDDEAKGLHPRLAYGHRGDKSY